MPNKYKKYYELGVKWFNKIGNMKEGYLCWIMLILIIIYEPNIEEFNYEIDEKMEFDDYLYDVHTKIGKNNSNLRLKAVM